MSGHAFLAVDLSGAERHALAAALTEASPGRRLPGRHTRPENWHITTRFLGACTDAQADEILYRLAETIDVCRGNVWCSGLGAFPRPSKATVLYGAVEDPDGILGRLAAWSDEAAQVAGFSPEDRPYVPHLTLARIRPPADVAATFASWGDFRARIGVGSLTLMRTRRAGGTIRYVPVGAVALL